MVHNLRINHIYKSFNKSIEKTYENYLIIKRNNKYKWFKKVYIFNGRSLRQKLISHFFKRILSKLNLLKEICGILVGQFVQKREYIHLIILKKINALIMEFLSMISGLKISMKIMNEDWRKMHTRLLKYSKIIIKLQVTLLEVVMNIVYRWNNAQWL